MIGRLRVALVCATFTAAAAVSLTGCSASADSANTQLPSAADQAACEEARTVIGVADIKLAQLARQPAEAAQDYLDYASKVSAATRDGSPGLASAGAQISAAYERLSASAVSGSAPDTDALRDAVADFVDVCGTGDPFTPVGTG